MAGIVFRVVGPCAALVVYVLLSWEGVAAHGGCVTGALATLMAIWWITEAVPLAVTALLPLIVLPACGAYAERASDVGEAMKLAARGYADPSLYLFLGGFILALGVERWGLHRRLALCTLRVSGTRPAWLLLGLMAATAFASLWISNTATTAMMLPIALSLSSLLRSPATLPDDPRPPELPATTVPNEQHDEKHFSASLLLGVAYAASIGGCGTLIGTPTNAIFRGFAAEHGLSIGFGTWIAFALPVVIVYLLLAWWLLHAVLFPVRTPTLAGGDEQIAREWRALGPLSRGEAITLALFVTTALAWIVREPLQYFGSSVWPGLRNLDDTVISLTAAVLMFLVPVDVRRGEYLLDWATARKLPWDVLLVFGGGLSLSQAITGTGMDHYLGQRLTLFSALPLPLLLGLLCLTLIFCSELTSNVAMMAAFAPVVHGMALEMKVDPLLLLLPTTLSCSYAFMLPAGTPPNAMAYATEKVTLGQMMRAGLMLNLAGGILIPLATLTLGRWVFRL